MSDMGESYYAGDRKVELDRAEDYVAVDQEAAHSAGLDAEAETASRDAERRGGGVVIVPRVALDAQTIATLADAGALQPVYRYDDAVMVALPEVRVAVDSPDQRQAVMDVLSEADALPTNISDNDGGRLTVRPASGSGVDALKIANEIHERALDANASVRFIQFVPKPMVGPQRGR
jgi:hypothetical protein